MTFVQLSTSHFQVILRNIMHMGEVVAVWYSSSNKTRVSHIYIFLVVCAFLIKYPRNKQ